MKTLISKAGFIAVPSKFVEMARFEKVMPCGISYRGYIHHRWIFTVRDDMFMGFPKVPFIEAVIGYYHQQLMGDDVDAAAGIAYR